MSDLHGKIVRTFLTRLFLYITGAIASVVSIAALMWVVHTYNIPTTLVVPVAIFLFALTVGVWWLWHDTKREIMDSHIKEQKPKR
jgi:ABC-type nickel/cobalt efflux system permease component RcnA